MLLYWVPPLLPRWLRRRQPLLLKTHLHPPSYSLVISWLQTMKASAVKVNAAPKKQNLKASAAPKKPNLKANAAKANVVLKSPKQMLKASAAKASAVPAKRKLKANAAQINNDENILPLRFRSRVGFAAGFDGPAGRRAGFGD
ncbi:hypothetical protein [Thalassolituus sp. UBA2009]|uniref:hypothetical protein n=1 Tax=Thalassolituus sp. UBA2009 TaxID=1947658 RepID=UPI0032E390F5